MLGPWLEGTVSVRRFPTYRARLVVQTAFALICILLGYQFGRFLHAASAGTESLSTRPPGVEGFLPISGLMGALDWLYQGSLNRIHPAATMLLFIFLAVSFLLRKSFCSWICPVGFLSETLARVGQKLFGRNFRLVRWVDISLRGLKYLLLGFFLVSILGMGAEGLHGFIHSPYNRVSDVKMFLFFARLGTTAGIVLLVLAVGSIFVQGAWCRYLCPYGALLGLFSWMSPVKIRRDPDTCIDCGRCDQVCMARLPVSKKIRTMSVECTGCLDCVASCPVGPALTVGTRHRRFGVIFFASAVVLLYLAGYGAARLSGNWQNEIGDREYIERIANIDDPSYYHPGR